MNWDEMTLGEIEDIETYAGQPVAALADKTAANSKLTTALAWIIRRRVDSSFTISDARKLTRSELNALISSEDEDEVKKEH